jgi:hypothetical protein
MGEINYYHILNKKDEGKTPFGNGRPRHRKKDKI